MGCVVEISGYTWGVILIVWSNLGQLLDDLICEVFPT